jgi:hypothetical protein
LQVGSGATLNIRVVFLEGRTSSDALAFLKSPAVKAGIKLTAAFNPVLGIATAYLESLTSLLLSNQRNRVVSQGIFGMHDYGGPIGGGIGIGDYLFAQLPTYVSSGGGLHWNSARECVMHGDDPLDANYLLLRIAPHTGI